MSAVRLSLGLLLLCGALALAAPTQEQIIAETGLDPDLVSVLTVEGPEGKVLLVFVYVNERSAATRMRPELAEVLPAYVGKNAVLVWAYSEGGARWNINLVTFSQEGAQVRAGADNVVPVTEGFLSERLRADRPVAGLILLGEAVDPGRPFTVSYGTYAQATMAVEFVEARAVATVQDEPTQLEDVPATALGGVAEQDEPPAGPQPSGLSAEPASGDTAACDPCGRLCQWWRPCGDPCDPCTILPLFLLLLLGL